MTDQRNGNEQKEINPVADAGFEEFQSLKPNQVRAIEALARGETDVKAAEEAGVARKTIYRWKRDPDFSSALLLYRHRIFTATRDRLRHGAQLATELLVQAVEEGDKGSARDLIRENRLAGSQLGGDPRASLAKLDAMFAKRWDDHMQWYVDRYLDPDKDVEGSIWEKIHEAISAAYEASPSLWPDTDRMITALCHCIDQGVAEREFPLQESSDANAPPPVSCEQTARPESATDDSTLHAGTKPKSTNGSSSKTNTPAKTNAKTESSGGVTKEKSAGSSSGAAKSGDGR